jgi:hypothetical protein
MCFRQPLVSVLGSIMKRELEAANTKIPRDLWPNMNSGGSFGLIVNSAAAADSFSRLTAFLLDIEKRKELKYLAEIAPEILRMVSLLKVAHSIIGARQVLFRVFACMCSPLLN